MIMVGSDKDKNKKDTKTSFDKIMKSLLSVPPKENKDIQKKAEKERKTKKKRAR